MLQTQPPSLPAQVVKFAPGASQMANMNPTDIYVKQISTQMDNNNLK
jgi:hypothetical protein